jgi:oxalate decarboxylase/phosphoglucose isomerase-like protein (cupin superfamily)
MNGQGSVTMSAAGPPSGAATNSETAEIHAGDAIPIQLGEAHSFANTGDAPLEFMIVGVSRDATRRVDTVDVLSLFPRGGRGN